MSTQHLVWLINLHTYLMLYERPYQRNYIINFPGVHLCFFTTCVRSMREGTVFTGICLFTLVGGGVTPSLVRMGGTPFPGLNEGDPFPGLDKGVPHPRSGWGYSHPGQVPGQDGVVSPGYPPAQDWMGYPHPELDGLPPPP